MSNGQDKSNSKSIKRSLLPQKLKPLDHVKIFGSHLNYISHQKADSNDSGIGSVTNSSSTCSEHPKQQLQQQQQQQQQQQNQKPKNKTKIKKSNSRPHQFYRPPSELLSDSFTYRATEISTKTSKVPWKPTQNPPPKRSLSTLLPALTQQLVPELPKKQPSSIKRERPLPPIRQLSISEEIETDRYTYAASTTSTTLTTNKRNASVLSILLQSTPCVGVQTREIRPKKIEDDLEENQEENTCSSNDSDHDHDHDHDHDDSNYYHLLDYRNLVNDLPKPVVPLRPRYGQDDFEILYEQLDHIRETMPCSNIYNTYARII